MTRRAPLFVARQSYRRRRLRDGARLLPLFGAFLFLLPMLWAPRDGADRGTATDGIYLFAVWAGLIVVAAILSPKLAGADEGSTRDTGDDA